MGWTNTHLYEFQIRDVGFGLPDQEWGDGPIDARKVSLLSAIQDTGAKSFKYHYDFGDGWTHSIKIERTFPIVALADPMLIEATGRCPPEDVGGPWVYQEFREALADPAHERHAELAEAGKVLAHLGACKPETFGQCLRGDGGNLVHLEVSQNAQVERQAADDLAGDLVESLTARLTAQRFVRVGRRGWRVGRLASGVFHLLSGLVARPGCWCH